MRIYVYSAVSRPLLEAKLTKEAFQASVDFIVLPQAEGESGLLTLGGHVLLPCEARVSVQLVWLAVGTI